MTGLSASRSDGLMMIAFAPAEMRLRMSAICSDGPPLRLATITFETRPEASASALIEQIISSRQPLPISVLETPTTYLSAASAPPAVSISAANEAPYMRLCFVTSFLPYNSRGFHAAARFFVYSLTEVQAPPLRLEATEASIKAMPSAPSFTVGVKAAKGSGLRPPRRAATSSAAPR